ncbi:DNA primase [Candidatus Peregrinibacteria bacterium]|nr:DNA primase [Candidatus Peregrinibacteria bacterium]
MSEAVVEIKNRLAIENLVAEYVVLKKVGRNYKGLCPFHSEKTPSFIVSADKGIAYCFGCHKGGDIFNFLMEVENIDFSEALRILSEKTGVTLEKTSPKNFVKKDEKQVLIDIHVEAAKFFQEQLWQSEAGKMALDYVLKRGLSEKTIKRFVLGYAPDSFEETHQFLLKKKFTHQQILQAGLGQAKDTSLSKMYDRFRGRLMFPIWDGMGRVVGFGGRALSQGQEPKYLNSPETPIYQKNQLLYGFYQSKPAIKSARKAVVVEGYMDYLAAVQDGLENVVACSGTALTKRHLTMLKPYIDELILSFDMDNAGKEAAKRSFELTQEFEFVVKLLALPSGKDIADFVKDHSGDLVKLMDKIVLFTDFFYSDLIAKYDLNSLTEKRKALAEFAGFFNKLPSPVEKTEYVRRLSSDLGLPEIQIYDELKMRKLSADHPARQFSEEERKILNYQPEDLLSGLLVQFPKCFYEIKNDVSQDYFSEQLKSIYKHFLDNYNPSSTDQDAIFKDFPGLDEEIRSRVALLSLYAEEKYGSLPPEVIKKEMQDLVKKIQLDAVTKKRQNLQRKLKDAENSQNKEELEDVLLELSKLI